MSSESEKSQQEVAAAIKRTSRQVHNLTKGGVFDRVPSAADPNTLVYPWPATLERWLAHNEEKKQGDPAAKKRKNAELRAANADAELKEFRLEQLKGDWVRKAEYRAELRRILTAINGVLELAPGKHGPKLPGDATVAEKVAAVRDIVAEVRKAMRRAGAPGESTSESAA